MDIDAFRQHAHAFVDWMSNYLADVERYPVRAQVRPGEIASHLPDAAPEAPEEMARIFRDFEDVLLPGVTHWQHPSFFAYFPANSSPPSVLAEMLTATLGVQGMLWQTSPAATELETTVLQWLRDAIGLPEAFEGVIQDTASASTLGALLVAREKATGWRVNEEGLSAGPPLVVYCSEEAHSSVEKDAKIAGYGRANVRRIPADARFAMIPEALEAAIAEDLAAGKKPACLVATLGTTGTSGFDPLRPLGEIARRHDLFFHVDAAWAGSALVLPEHRWMLDGIEHVDSFVFNPHKWLLTNFDCSAHFVRDPEALVRTFEIHPEYLKTREGRQVIDYRDWGVPLGRRFRALKLWFVLRSYGLSGLRAIIGEHIRLAHDLGRWIEQSEDFELLVPPTLALLDLRYHPKGVEDAEVLDRLNERLLERLNDSGRLYLTHTRVRGAYAIRFSIGQTRTEARHVEDAWQLIQRTARAIAAPGA